MPNLERDIFRRGSTTYYFSSQFFPKAVRADVFRLYSFVRVADNYVDDVPHQPERLLALEQAWLANHDRLTFDTAPADNDSVDQRIIKNIVDVARLYDFEPAWVNSFFDAMKADINPRPFQTITDTLGYIYGSAEVIGLMMARIMGLPDEALPMAALQGRAMQFINFIRDIAEDNALGRQYLPSEDLARYGLPDLSQNTALAQPRAFGELLRFELERYATWQREAAKGYRYIPKRYRVPLRTAVDMYDWTARQIARDPLIVFDRKVKPSKWRVMRRVAGRGARG
ncbi:MAG TPA: phytoene/squalene synthase family protein [Candidatus Saccharimonadia bacterium]